LCRVWFHLREAMVYWRRSRSIARSIISPLLQIPTLYSSRLIHPVVGEIWWVAINIFHSTLWQWTHHKQVIQAFQSNAWRAPRWTKESKEDFQKNRMMLNMTMETVNNIMDTLDTWATLICLQYNQILTSEALTVMEEQDNQKQAVAWGIKHGKINKSKCSTDIANQHFNVRL